jgi:hypothetical protein
VTLDVLLDHLLIHCADGRHPLHQPRYNYLPWYVTALHSSGNSKTEADLEVQADGVELRVIRAQDEHFFLFAITVLYLLRGEREVSASSKT